MYLLFHLCDIFNITPPPMRCDVICLSHHFEQCDILILHTAEVTTIYFIHILGATVPSIGINVSYKCDKYDITLAVRWYWVLLPSLYLGGAQTSHLFHLCDIICLLCGSVSRPIILSEEQQQQNFAFFEFFLVKFGGTVVTC